MIGLERSQLSPHDHHYRERSVNPRYIVIAFIALSILGIALMAFSYCYFTKARSLAASCLYEKILQYPGVSIAFPTTLLPFLALSIGISIIGNEKAAKSDVAKPTSQMTTLPIVPITLAPMPLGEITLITSPMPGICYPPFVQVGDKIEKGQALCIVEAMKMENTIRAPFRGRITEILVKDGEVMGINTPLLRLQKIE